MIQQNAPDFTAQALIPGDESTIGSISISQYRGKWVLLFFYPLNFTFVSPAEVTAFADRQNEFAALHCQVLACSGDSIYTHLAWCKTHRVDGGLGALPIPLVSDFDKSIGQAYGVLLPDGTTSRASFLIDPNGMIRHVAINDQVVSRNVDEALRVLREFQTTFVSPDAHDAEVDAGMERVTFTPVPVAHVPTTPAAAVTSAAVSVAATGAATGAGTVTDTTSTAPNALLAVLAWYTGHLRKTPLLTKAITSAGIGMIGELLGAYLRSRNPQAPKTDRMQLLKRLVVFGSYGMLCTGPLLHYWYAALERIAASFSLTGDIALLVKVLLQQGVFTPPFLLFTLAYINYFLSMDVTKTVREVKNAYAVALFTNWKVWTVAQAVNFKAVPLDYRVLFGNLVALWWNVYLSMLSAAKN